MSKRNSNTFLRYRIKQLMFIAVKITIVFGAGLFIYNKLNNNNDYTLNQLVNQLELHKMLTFKNCVILLLLTGTNWFLEIIKWKFLVSEIKDISTFKAIEQSLGSLTASIFTPNRIGEYGAKAIYFEKKHRKRVLGITLVGNLSQLLITSLLGIIGFIIFVKKFNPPIAYYKIFSITMFSIILLLFFFKKLKKYKFTIKGYSYDKLIQFLKSLQQKSLTYSVIISGFRYLVFAHQFYLLLTLFNVKISYIDAMTLISSFYLLVSILPSIFILDIVIKGGVAVWLFNFINASESIILAITLLMWLLNFAIPSIIGSYFVLRFKPNIKLPENNNKES